MKLKKKLHCVTSNVCYFWIFQSALLFIINYNLILMFFHLSSSLFLNRHWNKIWLNPGMIQKKPRTIRSIAKMYAKDVTNIRHYVKSVKAIQNVVLTNLKICKLSTPTTLLFFFFPNFFVNFQKNKKLPI